MMRLRPLRRRGAWAALFALALQIVLAFGHMHPLPTASAPVAVAALGGPLQSSGGDPSDAAQDICAICVTIHLASTVGLPPPPALPVPDATFHVVESSGSNFVLPRLPPHPFQTRAPPTA
jgi:hypothetical protein